jgi:hypothetical protein
MVTSADDGMTKAIAITSPYRRIGRIFDDSCLLFPVR